VRETDTVARLGGDEFIVLLEGCGDRMQLQFIVQRMRLHALQPLVLAGATLAPHLSIGVACYPGDGLDVDTLIRHADHAMYTAKRDGGNIVRYHQDLAERQARESG
jgi:diguanylate cyclase (GGDEF)-like protein